MKYQLSTFDKLVETISTDEAQMMLTNIADSMRTSVEMRSDISADSLLNIDTQQKAVTISNESFFVRLWFRLQAFITSVPVETIYENELIKRIGKNLHRNYRQYINIKANIFTNDFYELLRALRKTQLFFSSLLAAYHSDKGNFYLLASSFAAPEIYAQLIRNTDPFASPISSSVSTNLRAEFLKTIDETFSLMSSIHKSDMYQCAHAIEWMHAFCELPLDKVLLRFTVEASAEATCPIHLIGTEIGTLASLLHTVQPISDIVLQTLFLLSKQDQLNDKSLNLNKESVEFISQASHAVEAIKYFSIKIPILQFARYAENSIHWEPKDINGGEDWFLLFKNAWKKRFNERWQRWSAEQKRIELRKQVFTVLKIDKLPELPYRPWEDAWIVLRFKREFSFAFLSAFFSGLYPNTIQQTLKILLMEGNFYRRENLAEYTNAFTILEKQQNYIETFVKKISPEGEIGSTFHQLKQTPMANLKNKTNLETLMKGIETEAKQIISSTQGAVKSLTLLLHGFIERNKGSLYAPLVNWTNIQGSNNADFRKQVEEVNKKLQKIVIILTELETIEAEY